MFGIIYSMKPPDLTDEGNETTNPTNKMKTVLNIHKEKKNKNHANLYTQTRPIKKICLMN